MKHVLLCCILIFLTASLSAQTPAKIKTSDLELLKGEAFTGTATQHNQAENSPITAEMKLTVLPGTEKNTWELQYEFPGNASDNETVTLKIISGGRYLNDQQITARTVTDSGLIKIVTEEAGDNGFYVYRYLIGPSSFNLKVMEKTSDDSFIPVKSLDLKR